MSQSLIYFLIAISLSIDAFSVTLSIGTSNPSTKDIIKLSSSIGMFHLFMPIIGSQIASIITFKTNYSNYITAIIFIILAIEMYLNKEEKIKINIINFLTIIIISFSVSIDSLSIGFALSLLKNNVILASIIFSLISFLFSISGLFIGKLLKIKYNKIANYIGIIILLLLALKYLIT